MSTSRLSEKVRHFIFQHIDSVELLDVLFYLRNLSGEGRTAAEISRELRSNEESVALRLENLFSIGLIESKVGPETRYHYKASTPVQDEIVSLLFEDYKSRRHLILELIFSPSRQAKRFADAFVFKKKKGDRDDS